MSNDREKLRRVEGGVGTLNTKVIKKVKAEAPVGKLGLGFYVPAGSIVVGAFIKNQKNDLVGDGATVALTCGNVDFIDATAVATIKGSGVGGCFEGHYIEADTEVELEVATAPLTDGTLEIGILYM
jgi:hypothetical protein